MGLDQYLEKVKKGQDKLNGEQLYYWRKVNPIHKWFTDNCADGDMEKTIDGVRVTISDLKKLRDDIKLVLDNKNKAKEVLPTQEGFFFGGYDYDEYYFDSLESTYKWLTGFIENQELDIDEVFEGGYDIYYSASW